MSPLLPNHVTKAAVRLLGTTPGIPTLANRRDQIVDVLRSAVLAGEMEEGVVYSAPALAAQFGVSPTPVREAMITLTRERLVSVAPNKGFVVSSPTPQELTDMLETRVLLEVPMVRLVAAAGITDDQHAELLALADETIVSAENNDFIAHVLSDLNFHVTLVGLAGNDEITNIVRTLRSRWRLHGLNSNSKRGVLLETARQHREIVDLVNAGMHEEAAALLETHLRTAGSAWKPDATHDDA